MKNLIIALLALFTLTLFNSCSGIKAKYQTASITQVKDSIVYVETVRFDTIRIPADKAQINIPITHLSELKNGYSKTFTKGRANASIDVENDTMKVTANCSDLEKIIALKDRQLKQYQLTNISKTTTPKHITSNSKFAVFCIWYAIIITVIIGLFIYFKIK